MVELVEYLPVSGVLHNLASELLELHRLASSIETAVLNSLDADWRINSSVAKDLQNFDLLKQTLLELNKFVGDVAPNVADECQISVSVAAESLKLRDLAKRILVTNGRIEGPTANESNGDYMLF